MGSIKVLNYRRTELSLPEFILTIDCSNDEINLEYETPDEFYDEDLYSILKEVCPEKDEFEVDIHQTIRYDGYSYSTEMEDVDFEDVYLGTIIITKENNTPLKAKQIR